MLYSKDNILETVDQVVIRLLEPTTLTETYSLIVKEIIKLTNSVSGSIFLIRQGKLKRVYASVPNLNKIQIRKKGHVYATYKTGKVKILNLEKAQKIHPELLRMGIRSILFIPLSYRNRSIGVLTVQSKYNQTLNTNELKIVKIFGSVASLKIRNLELYDEAKKAVENRDLFISMAAHEFRTPLTTISGYVQLLRNRLAPSNNVLKKWVNELTWETNRLSRLINDMLEVSRMKRGQLVYNWSECNLKEIISRVVNDFRVIYPSRTVNVEDSLSDTEILVIGDFDRLFQMISNLLDNAHKFSSAGKAITVSLRYDEPNYVLGVTDQGKGIARDDLKKVFEAFYKGDYTQTQGLGLGLFLAKDIVNHHHGSIHIHSKPEQGTSIEVNLPKANV